MQAHPDQEMPLWWAGQWPLPSWLGLQDGQQTLASARVRLVVADGSGHEGVLQSARMDGLRLHLQWRDQAGPQTMDWLALRSVTLLSPLARVSPAGHEGNPADRDRSLKQVLTPFEIRLTADHGGDVHTGQTLGHLAASHGLFLYEQSPGGNVQACWYSTAALEQVRVGAYQWHSRHKAAQPAPVAVPVPVHGQPAHTVSELAAAWAELHHRPAPHARDIMTELGCWPEDRVWQGVDMTSGDWLSELVQKGALTTEQSQHVLSRMAGLPEVDLPSFKVESDAMQLLASHARRYLVYPLGSTGDVFFAASADPTDQALQTLIASLLDRRVQLVWASRAAIIERVFRLEVGPAPGGRPSEARRMVVAPAMGSGGGEALGVPVEEQDLDQLMTRALSEVNADAPFEEVAGMAESSSFVLLVKRIIDDAQKLNVSDIHIETNPGLQGTRIRFRRDGDLEPYLELPPLLRAPLVSRIKVMARLDIAERRRAQDGKINFAEFGGSHLELRVAVLPTHDGLEDVVMRLLASGKPIPLASLGFQERDSRKVKAMSSKSYGLILAAGPTGSGKTTTLHSMLKELNTDQKKIWTAEDPIEITQDGLRQVQVNHKIGVTFASAMRAFLRADPDIIMIGEIRDDETAKIAIEASLTGHLVLSSLHTNNASESVVRLLDLGMDPMNFGDSLVGVVAQRLVRALCPRCASQEALPESEFDLLVSEYIEGTPLTSEQGRERLLCAANTPVQGLTLRKATGCPHCNGKGYKGRMGVYEILENSPTLRGLIQRRSRPSEVFEAAIRAGMRSLRHDALEKALQGRIDLLQARAAYG